MLLIRLLDSAAQLIHHAEVELVLHQRDVIYAPVKAFIHEIVGQLFKVDVDVAYLALRLAVEPGTHDHHGNLVLLEHFHFLVIEVVVEEDHSVHSGFYDRLNDILHAGNALGSRMKHDVVIVDLCHIHQTIQDPGIVGKQVFAHDDGNGRGL